MELFKINSPEDLTEENMAKFDAIIDAMDKQFYSTHSINGDCHKGHDVVALEDYIERIREQYGLEMYF